MPILTYPLSAEGPIVEIEVGCSRAHARALRQALQPIPQPLRVQALIDSGAATTCLTPDIITRLGLPHGNFELVNFPAAGGLSLAMEYDAGLRVLHPLGNPNEDLILT